MREWKDPNTGCRVRQLTDFDGGASRSYFRVPCTVPDGRVVVTGTKEGNSHLWLVDLESGELGPRPNIRGYNTLHQQTGDCWFTRGRELWTADLVRGMEEMVCRIPDEIQGRLEVNCDGTLAWSTYSHPPKCEPNETQKIEGRPTAQQYHHMAMEGFRRSAGGGLKTLNLRTGEVRKVHEFHVSNPGYLACSPTDPDLVTFAYMGPCHLCQRIWLARSDGHVLPIRPQQQGEAVIHEFWWPEGQEIGFKYMDCRNVPTMHEMHLLEYVPAPLQIGIASLAGEQVWLSDPVEHYQSHIIISPDQRWFCGEGTHDWFCVTVAAFDRSSTRLDFRPVATTHAPYFPASAAGIEASFSADSRWVIYNDKIAGVRQVYAVEVPQGY